MRTVRLIRRVLAADGTGPGNGQYALQRALRQRIRQGLDWLAIGGAAQPGELPWFWCWKDRAAAVRWARAGEPFVQGPNTFFLDSRRPGADALERALLDSPQCRMMFTESEWYRDLVLRWRGRESRAEIVLWPYPIDPRPRGPLHPPQYDVLIYVKSGRLARLGQGLESSFPRPVTVHYGRFRRESLWEAARRSACCCYLADDDRGPLALAEILLCGCPAVGLPTGAPFLRPNTSGVWIESLRPEAWIEAVEACRAISREHVSEWARREFDPARIASIVLGALDRARRGVAR